MRAGGALLGLTLKALIAAGLLAAAVSGPVVRAQSGLVEDPREHDILTEEAERAQSKRSGDATRLRRLLAPDFVQINTAGWLLDRRRAVLLANPQYGTEDVQLRLYPGAALVTGRESDEGIAPGLVRFLRVWIRVGPRWLEALDQETPIVSAPVAARESKTTGVREARVVTEAAGVDANHVAGAPEAPVSLARDVRTAERAYRGAERINDLTTLERLRAPEFSQVNRLGVVVRPSATRPLFKGAQDDDFSVRVHGAVGLVIGSVLRSYATTDVPQRYRYVTVWIERQGKWQVIAEQQTPIG